ncbi:MAG: insulinase family protein [Alphaproteobacteria bacterium]|nr:insulinase family protein [Alphaproteobacteria bacterium]
MRLSVLFALFLLLLPCPSFAKDTGAVQTPEKVFNAQSYMLDNGLQVVVVENHRAPVVTHMIWYRVGAAEEQPGKSGMAHFMEHLMFKGQTSEAFGDIAPGDFSKIVRSLGGKDNAFTSQDYTAYYQSVASDQLETVMTMEAGRMRGMSPPADEVVSENKVILEERRQRTDNDPRAQMDEQLNAALFVNHPYGIPVIGWLHEMEGLTWDDEKAFYDLWYEPNNAILVVSGDVTGPEVLALAQKTYGKIPSAKVPERIRTVSPPFVAQMSVTLAHSSIREPSFQRGYRVPSARQNKQDSLALEVLEEIMGGGATSRLYKDLVVEGKVASSISISYSGNAWDDATVWIAGVPAEGNVLQDVEAAVDDELRKLIAEGVRADELKDAVTRMQADAIYARDSLSGPAMTIGYGLITGSTLDDIEYWPRDIEMVSADQVQDVAKRFLNPDAPAKIPPVTGYLLPKEGGDDQGLDAMGGASEMQGEIR